MSICRNNGVTSDVYVYYNSDGPTCCACSLNNNRSMQFKTEKETYKHLKGHIHHGHKVPGYAMMYLSDCIIKDMKKKIHKLKEKLSEKVLLQTRPKSPNR